MIFKTTLLAHTLAFAALVAANPVYIDYHKHIRQDDGSSTMTDASIPPSTSSAATSTATVTSASAPASETSASPTATPVQMLPLKYYERQSAWTVDMKLGGQPFEVQVDLESSVLAVLSAQCKDIFSCLGRPLFEEFQATEKLTRVGAANLTDAGVEMEGWLYKENLHLGDLTIPNQDFLALDALPAITAFQAFGGVLGLGFPDNTSDASNATLVALNSTQGLGRYGFQLSAITNSSSELSIGGANSNKFTGSIYSYPIDDSGMWQLSDASVRLDNGTDLSSGFSTRLSLSTRGIWGPADVVNKMYGSIPGARRWPDQEDREGVPQAWVVPCSSIGSRSLTFSWDGETNWEVKRFALWELDNGRCLGSVVGYPTGDPLSDANVWTLGQLWMESAYHVFDADNKQVGFAMLADSESS